MRMLSRICVCRATAQSRLLRPRLCVLLLCSAFMPWLGLLCVCARADHATECCPPPAQANAASRLLFATAIAISSSWPIRCQPQTVPTALTVCRLRCALTELDLISCRSEPYICSGLHLHCGARCPLARRGPLPALGSHGPNGNFILSFPNGSSWLSSPKVRPSTDAPAGPRRPPPPPPPSPPPSRPPSPPPSPPSVVADSLSITATSPPPTPPSSQPPPPPSHMWICFRLAKIVPLPPSPSPPPSPPHPTPVHHPLRFAALTIVTVFFALSLTTAALTTTLPPSPSQPALKCEMDAMRVRALATCVHAPARLPSVRTAPTLHAHHATSWPSPCTTHPRLSKVLPARGRGRLSPFPGERVRLLDGAPMLRYQRLPFLINPATE